MICGLGRTNTALRNCSSETVIPVAVSIVAGAFFVGMGLYGLHLNPHMWGSYVIIGLGGAAILGGLSIKVVGWVWDALQSRRPPPDLPVRLVQSLKTNDKSYYNFQIADDVMHLIFEMIAAPRTFEAYKLLSKLQRVCSHWYTLVNSEKMLSRKLLDSIYRIHTLFFQDFSGVEECFPQEIRDQKVVLTDEMLDNHSLYFGDTGYPENSDNYIKWMRSNNTAIIGGIDGCHRRFFAVGMKIEDKETIYEGVMVFFQRYTDNPNYWRISQLSPNTILHTDNSRYWIFSKLYLNTILPFGEALFNDIKLFKDLIYEGSVKVESEQDEKEKLTCSLLKW
ncbi:MAG: hypothetical protein JJU12_00780 [Chlamydiales bacterium]|nr:hypothetical protein [Chlamydiales bacterium]